VVGLAEQYDGVVVVDNGSVVVEVGIPVVSEDDDIVERTVVTANVLDLDVVGLLDAGLGVDCSTVVVLVATGDVVDGV